MYQYNIYIYIYFFFSVHPDGEYSLLKFFIGHGGLELPDDDDDDDEEKEQPLRVS